MINSNISSLWNTRNADMTNLNNSIINLSNRIDSLSSTVSSNSSYITRHESLLSTIAWSPDNMTRVLKTESYGTRFGALWSASDNRLLIRNVWGNNTYMEIEISDTAVKANKIYQGTVISSKTLCTF